MFFELTHNWWALAIRGIAAIIFGALAFLWPGMTLLALVVLFGAYATVDGIFAIVSAVRGTGGESGWVLLLEGILGITAGVLALFVPGITAFLLLYIIAFWSLITGIFEIVTAIRLRREIPNEWLMALSGIASILFGILLFNYPRAGALAVVWWIGAYALIFGVLLLALAIRLRAHSRRAIL
jgi:uncharacterized membrane protein HdeD (DUF308 family)